MNFNKIRVSAPFTFVETSQIEKSINCQGHYNKYCNET